MFCLCFFFFFFSSRRRHTRFDCDWSSDVCSSDLPEALSGDDLDTRTDVYSLGVMLYEILAGVRPHKIDDLPLAGIIRTVSENDAPMARTLFRALADTARGRIAEARRDDERALDAILGGDLGWISRKATARERDERYGSAADFQADLQRYRSE